MCIREWAEDEASPPVAKQSAVRVGAEVRRSQWSVSRAGSAVMDYGVPGGDRHCTVVYNNWLSSATGEPLSQAELQPVAEWLANGSVRRVVCGHQPHGDTPLALRLPEPVSGRGWRRVAQMEVKERGGGVDAGAKAASEFGGVAPVVPWRVKGEAVRGYGRGSKTLGIPTANLPPEAWDQVSAFYVCGPFPSISSPVPNKFISTVRLSKHTAAVQVLGGVPAQTSGIYAGWASVGSDPTVYPMALSVGWNPHFDRASASDSASHR